MCKLIGTAALGLMLAFSPQSQVQAQANITVCFVTFSLQVGFFQASVQGGREEAEAQGVELLVFDPQGDVQRQVQQMEDCIARNADAIVIDAIESGAVTGTIEEAAARGITVVAVDTIIEHPDVVSNIGVSNFEASREFGQFLAGWIMSKYDGNAQIGIMLASTEVQLARRDGFMAALNAVPDSQVVATGDGRNILERAIAEAEDMLTANPGVQVIYATGDPQLQGALAAAEAQGRDDIDFFGWDDLPEPFIRPLEEGRIVGFTTQLPAEQGRLGVRHAVMAVRGESIPSYVASPVEIITQHNLDQYR